ncbi:hypothetical protein DCAR_0416058 [Daucus carota subsp. sativus]|uniref:Uncharacterized protein n=1 Tax=Daucus carota subsp. sativus TaxID=79200 RepID=A0AAF1AXI7_DAUCS|nr:hypothetical protein DCAR_0416058 [Daucus carota subsp. sativus]
MSEQATLFCSSFGLLGGYCPSSRIKDKVGCMHIEALQGFNRNCEGCQFTRPCQFIAKDTKSVTHPFYLL